MDPRIALVPCCHRRFRGPCAEEVHNRGLCCPMWRSPIQIGRVCFNCVSRFFRIVCAIGVRVYPYPRVYPTRPVPAGTGRVG